MLACAEDAEAAKGRGMFGECVRAEDFTGAPQQVVFVLLCTADDG
jgi:hypothetical protein